MDSNEIIKRLAFIKYLYGLGEAQAEKPEPMCWAALLTFHDAVELNLQLIAEYVELKKAIGEVHFLDYWTLLNNKLRQMDKPEITQKISMERLNKARVNFKHYGNAPSKSAIVSDFGVNTKNFLEDSTEAIFGLRFSDVSLIDLVTCEAVKKDLNRAEELIKSKSLEESLSVVAVAFNKLTDDYESRKTDDWGDSPFSFGQKITFTSAFGDLGRDIGRSLDAMKDSISSLIEIVKIIGFGIDLKRYGKFKWLTPQVYRYSIGEYEASAINKEVGKIITLDDVRFCVDFVIESALVLQEFDYALTHSPASRPNYHKIVI